MIEYAAKVSLVVPCYNVEEYIDECMSSLVGQSYPNLEIVVVNDGSTDSTLEKLQRFASDDRVRIITQDNQGLGQARNTGIHVFTGDYLTFVDSDDYLALDAVENLVAEAERSGSDIVIGARVKFNSRAKWLSPAELFAKRLSGVKVADHRSIYGLVAVHGKLFRSSFFRKHKLSFQAVRAQEDAAFTYIAYGAAALVSVIPEETYFYRKREGGGASITQARLRPHNLMGRFNQIEATLALSLKGDGSRRYPRSNYYRLEFQSRLMRHILAIPRCKDLDEFRLARSMLSAFSQAYSTEIAAECSPACLQVYEALWSGSRKEIISAISKYKSGDRAPGAGLEGK